MTARSRPTRASDSSVAIRSIRTSSATLLTRGSLPAGTRSRRSFDFRPQGLPEPATQMTELPRGDQVLARAIDLRFRIGARDVKRKTPTPRSGDKAGWARREAALHLAQHGHPGAGCQGRPIFMKSYGWVELCLRHRVTWRPEFLHRARPCANFAPCRQP